MSTAREWGATWVASDAALTAEVDILVSAALGGLLTARTVPSLRSAAVAGPANNQLDRPDTAALLAARGVLWAPDAVVSAGGVIHALGVELHQQPEGQVTERIDAIAATLRQIVRTARTAGTTPATAARQLAEQWTNQGNG
ncbi:hypothetical protein ACJ6WF_26205 [Streptomyces sp. MMS24-I2-30]|uniref:hypothetical protein n=1 Tax=Streptomyces sp. MMS24-I2-30 TaxID=3351564 RepID=UPI003896ECF1